MLLSLALLSLCLSGVLNQFPKACTTDEALKKRRCCPRTKDGSLCGFSSGRGHCQFIHEPYIKGKSFTEQNDDRLDWPHEYYDSVCICNGAYSGYDCGECKFGYYGEKCDQKKTIVRREIRELSCQERLKFFSYLSLAKIKTSARFNVLTTGNRHDRSTFRFVEASMYNVFAWMHYYSFQPLLTNNMFNVSTSFAHEGPGFPTWHRWYLLFLEREIQIVTNDYDFSLPYYDWSRDYKGCSICTDEFMGKSDSQGILTSSSYFASWKSICSGFDYIDKYCPVADDECQMESLHRNPGADPSNAKLPTAQQVEDVLQWAAYDTSPYDTSAKHSFRNCLEGFMDPANGEIKKRSLHNLFHMYMGGTISQVQLSSNDPIFVLHYAFIDKIFERWIQKYNATCDMYPQNHIFGHGPEENIVPSMPPVMNKDYLTGAELLGYKYSNYSPHVVSADFLDSPELNQHVKGKQFHIYTHTKHLQQL